jgi:hypothetical protein
MQLVILAAGHGRRFGGLKQLVPVGPHGEAMIDYTALDAMSCGFTGIVLVVRREIEDEMLEHVRRHWPAGLECESVVQEGHAGTAQAVYSAAPALSGPFGVANADDLYGLEALELLRTHLEPAHPETTADAPTGHEMTRGGVAAAGAGKDADSHLLVGFRLGDTIFTDDTVTRGVCRADAAGWLTEVLEQKVTAAAGGYSGVPISDPGSPPTPLSGDELVSMNLWGLQPRMLDHLRAALEDFDPPPPPADAEKPPELLLPEVVRDVVARAVDRVRVLETKGRCIGITHPDDLEFVRNEIGDRRPGDLLPQSS